MRLSRSFWAVVIGATICLVGMAGISYFNYIAPELWGGGSFDFWLPICVIAVCLGMVVICASLVFGFVSGLVRHLRHQHEKDVA